MPASLSDMCKDAWFDEHWQLDGIILNAGRRFLTAMKAVQWSDVLICGDDAVIIMNEALDSQDKQTEVQRFISYRNHSFEGFTRRNGTR